MPQLRSYTGFASTPNIGSAFVGGANIAVQREKIANDYAMAEMEAAARRAALQQQALQQAQELEVTKSIKQQQLGLQARELEQQQQKLSLASDQAAQQYEARQLMRKSVEESISQGRTPAEAIERAAAIHGVQAGAPGQLMGDIIQRAPGGANAPMGVPTAIDLNDEEGNPTGQKIYQASPNRYATLPREMERPTESTPVPGSEGTLLQYGKKFFPNPKLADITEMTKKRDAITKSLDSGDLEAERRQFMKAQDPDAKLTATQKALAKKYADKLEEFKTLNEQITEARTAMKSGGRATLPSGLDTGGTTNKIGRFKVIQRAR